MKKINVEEAESWSAEEAAYNIQYLTARNREAEVQKILILRGIEEDGEEESVEDLSSMTKAELLSLAEQRGVDADGGMKKAEIIDALQG